MNWECAPRGYNFIYTCMVEFRSFVEGELFVNENKSNLNSGNKSNGWTFMFYLVIILFIPNPFDKHID